MVSAALNFAEKSPGLTGLSPSLAKLSPHDLLKSEAHRTPPPTFPECIELGLNQLQRKRPNAASLLGTGTASIAAAEGSHVTAAPTCSTAQRQKRHGLPRSCATFKHRVGRH